MDKILGFLKGKGQEMASEILQLDDIIIDNGLNPRDGALDQEVILDYAAHVDDLPSMHVFRLDEVEGSGIPGYYLTRGFHRIAAHRLAGRTSAHFIVHVGTFEEAREDADLDNLKHGLRLSRAERRAVIERQLKRHPDWSDTRLATACSTTNKTVRAVRDELEETKEIPRLDTLMGSDGIWRPRELPPRVVAPEPDPGQTAFESVEEFRVEATGADAAPEYVSVWKLEQGIRTWLVNMQLIDPNGQLHILEAIKLKTPDGAPYLETLLTTDVLAGPRRKSDVIQAVNNLYAQKLRLRAEVGESDDDLAELEQLETEERAAAEQDAGLLGEAETQFLKVTVQDLEILPTAPTPDPNPPGSVQQSLLCYCRSCGKERWISRATHDKDLRVRCLFCYAAAEAKLWRSEPLPPEADDAQDLAELERVSPERAEAEAFLGPAPTEAPKPREAHLTLNVSVRPDGSALITAILGINPVATKATTWQRVGLDVQIIVNEHAPRPAAVEAVEPEAPEGRAGVVDT